MVRSLKQSVVIALAALMGLSVLTPPMAMAQEGSAEPAAGAHLAVTDAHIEGSGPWTSWFGAAPDREIVITVANIGSTVVEDPQLALTLGKGANPTDLVAPPKIGRLEPGESTTVRAELDLPTFAIGTYAVEGSFIGFDPPVGFRAETSHIPWLPLVLPLLILIQLGLVLVRNRVRDRIHGPARTSDPTLPEPEPAPAVPTGPEIIDLTDEPEPEPVPVELETIIGEELGAVFDEAFGQRDDSADDAEFRGLIVELAGTAAGRAAARADLNDLERAALDTEMADAVLAAFGFEPSAIG